MLGPAMEAPPAAKPATHDDAPPPATAAPPAGPTTAAFLALIRDVWNGRREERLRELLSPGFTMHVPGGRTLDLAGYEATVQEHHAAFPDLEVEVLRTLEQGDLCAAQIVLKGTMLGPFAGHAATERAMRVEGRPWARVHDGRIVELWSLTDDESMWAQLGLPPHTL